MKKTALILIVLLMLLGLCSCGEVQQKYYEPSDYVLEMPYKDDFRILQLSDIHLANKDNRKLHYDFMTLTINDADADMIILTGDSFTYADKTVAKELFAFIDSFGIPWSFTFGNHDEQCYFSVDWLTDYLNNFGSNCVFKDLQDDDVYGNANFAIDLMSDGKVTEQLVIMDSNRYNYGDYWGYDCIKGDQILWYEGLVNYTTEQNDGSVVPSILLMHIPFPEFETAISLIEAGDGTKSNDGKAVLEYGEYGEGVSCPEINSGMFSKIKELGSTNAVIVGHDHVNNLRMLYDGVYLVYGVNSTNRIYCDENMMGGHVIIIHDDGSLDFEHIYHSYSEVQND